jgi:hypothetical protein
LADGIRCYLAWRDEEGRLEDERWSAIHPEYEGMREEGKQAQWEARLAGREHRISPAGRDLADARVGQERDEWKRLARNESWDDATRRRRAEEAIQRVRVEVRALLHERLSE